MKKSNFVALILGTVSGILFSLGMCMALLPEWNAFAEGVIFSGIGLLLGIIDFFVWCKMENKKWPKLNAQNIFFIVFGIVGALVLGTGMCMCLVWNIIIWGTLVGFLGIVMLVSLIPMIKGIK